MAPLCNRIGLVGPVPKRRSRLSLTNRRYGWNLGSLIEPNLKRQSNEWKHTDSPLAMEVCPTQCAVKVMFIVGYDNDGVILHHAVPPRQTVSAAHYWTFLHHHLRREFRRKREQLLGGIEPHHSSWQCKESHRCCCHGPLAPLAMGDSGTSTVLTRCESIRLRSLRQNERTTARGPVLHKRWTYPCYRAVNMEHQQRWTRWWCTTPPNIWQKLINKGDQYTEGT